MRPDDDNQPDRTNGLARLRKERERLDTRPDDLEIYRDKAGEYRWRRVAPTGETIADGSEGYRTFWGAKRAARRVNGKQLPVYDMRWAA